MRWLLAGGVVGWAVLVVLGAGTQSNGPLLSALVLLFVAMLAWCAMAAGRRYVLALFLGAFGLFLLARPLLSGLGLVDERRNADLLPWSESTRTHVLLCLVLTLIGLWAGAVLAERLWGGRDDPGTDQPGADADRRPIARRPSVLAPDLRLIALVLLAPVLLSRLLVTFERVRYVQQVGFYSLYTEFTSALPGPVVIAAGMFDLLVFAVLATRPSRRTTWLVLGLYLAEGITQLATLQRSGFFLNLLLIGVYLCYRHYSRGPGERPWLTVGPVLTAAAALPVMMVASNAIASARGRNSGASGGPLDAIFDFVYSQGVTANVIAFTDQLGSSLPRGRWYSFGPVIEFVQYRVLGIFTGATLEAGNTVERATQGHQLSHVVSYLVMPDVYLTGSGYGSTYVAELFLDAGYAGIVIGSVVLGMLLGQLPRAYSAHLLVCLLALLVTRELFFVVRGSYTGFLVNPFALPNLAGMAGIGTLVALAWAWRQRQQAVPT